MQSLLNLQGTYGADVDFDDRNEGAPRWRGVRTLCFDVHTKRGPEDIVLQQFKSATFSVSKVNLAVSGEWQ